MTISYFCCNFNYIDWTMVLKTLLIVTFNLFVTVLFCQNNTFYRKYNLSGMQGALQLEVTNDGGFIATGQHEGNGSHGDCDIYVYKLDVCGNIEWFKIYGTAGQEGGKSIIQLNDGNYLVSGLYSGTGTYRAFNMKIDQQGNVIWIKRYACEWMMYTKESTNGDLISFGRNAGLLFLIRTNSLGNVIWTKQINGFGDMGLWLDELPNGDIVVTSVNNSIGKDIAVGKFDFQGNPIWMNGYGGNGWTDVDHTTWSCKGAINNLENTLVVTSPTLSGGFSDENVLVSKISLVDGSVIWSRAIGGNGRDQSRDIVKYPGGYAILGHTNSFPTPINNNLSIYEALGEKDILLFSIDENGQTQWSRTYGGADRDKGVGVKFNNDNGFSISAFTTSPYFGNVDASFDPLFIKTDSVGKVGCQMHSPILQNAAFPLVPVNAGTVQAINLASDVPAISMVNFTPNDQYLCQSCTSIPDFSLSDTLVCVNDSIFLSNTTIIGLTCFQEWNIEGQFLNGDIDPVLTFPNPGVYSIYLYSTCGANSDTIIKNIYVIDPTITIPNFICSNSPQVNFQASISNGIWSGQNVSPIGNFSPNNLAPGSYTVTYTIPNYCSVSDSLEVRPIPIIDAGTDTSFCIQATYSLQALQTPNCQFAWNPSLYLSSAVISNPQLSFVNNSTTSSLLPYILTVNDTITTCTNSDTVEFIIYPEPQVFAGNDTLICEGSTYIPIAVGASSFLWNNTLINGVASTLPLLLNELIVLGVDSNLCTSFDTVFVQVNLNPQLSAGNDTLICIGNSLILNGVSPQNVTYSWDVNCVNGNYYTPSTIGQFQYIVTAIDINLCSQTDTIQVQIHDLPQANFSYLVDCYSTNVALTNTSNYTNLFNDVLNYNWYLNSNFVSNIDSNFVQNVGSSGISNVDFIVTSQLAGCSDTVSQLIEVPTNPSINFDYIQNCDYSIDFQGDFPPNETILNSYWYTDSMLFAENTNNSTFQYQESGSYIVNFVVNNDFPCQYSIEKIITVILDETIDQQTIPNVFTPNNDGTNDEIAFNELVNECIDFEVFILNRWGNLVYKAGRNDMPFTGKDLNGSELTEGIYFYKISSNDQTIHGHITIIK